MIFQRGRSNDPLRRQMRVENHGKFGRYRLCDEPLPRLPISGFSSRLFWLKALR
jgi:hypothetical protein